MYVPMIDRASTDKVRKQLHPFYRRCVIFKHLHDVSIKLQLPWQRRVNTILQIVHDALRVLYNLYFKPCFLVYGDLRANPCEEVVKLKCIL